MPRNRITTTAVLFLLFAVFGNAHPAIFGLDGRVRFEEATNADRLGLLYATGSISCLDGSQGTGFLVDISDYVERDTTLTIVVTSARVLYDGTTGRSRGDCAFRPASAPGQYLKLGEKLVGSTRAGHIDRNDWAFARLGKTFGSLGFGRLKIESTFDLRDAGKVKAWAAGFVPKWDNVAVASDCKADTGRSYSSLSRRKDGLASMLIHDCDTMMEARGGPLAVRANGTFRVVAIHAGSSREGKHKDLYGIPYDPQKNFFNYSRQFDNELEGKLIAFVSRFAHVKTPSTEIHARSQLVREIQINLNRLGYDSGKEDGLLGEKTKDAIRAFQSTLGISSTGRVSEELLLLLKARTGDDKIGN